MENEKSISVLICYAQSHHQEIISLVLPQQATVLQAIQQSGILHNYPEIDLAKNSVGIYGKIVSLDQVLRHGDRIEIYRPLHLNPRQARRQRQAQQKH